MAQRVLAVSGLNLDRAWPEFEPTIGSLLRQRSLDLLGEVVQTGLERDCSAVLLLGDTVDRGTVRQDTLDVLASAVEALDRTVIVVPGPRDWYDDNSPYALRSWPRDVHVCTTAQWEVVAGLAVSAWVDRSGAPSPYGSPGAPFAARPAATQAVAGAHLLTTDSTQLDPSQWATRLRPLQNGPGQVHGDLCLIDLDTDGSEDGAPAVLPAKTPGSATHHLDVTDIGTTQELQAALGDAVRRAQPLDTIRIVGQLQVGVLLPDYSGDALARNDVVVEWSGLEFAFPDYGPDDRSVRAELARALARAPREPRQRHQALSLGLRALAVEEGA